MCSVYVLELFLVTWVLAASYGVAVLLAGVSHLLRR